MPTNISWAEETWNPTIGCTRVSPGCDSCYAIRQARIREANPNPKIAAAYEGVVHRDKAGALDWTGRVNQVPDRLDAPLRWRTPRRIFVDSMSDLFHDNVSDEYIARVFAVMSQAPQHVFQVLTKRHGRMRSLLNSERFQSDAHSRAVDLVQNRSVEHEFRWPLPNVWLGVSVENQQWADIRIPALLDTPAAVRWLSCEPLLGPVDLSWGEAVSAIGPQWARRSAGGSEALIDWVVVGGESGPNARPMHPAWARSIRDQCAAASVPFHFKQHGEWGPAPWTVRVCDPKTRWQGTEAELEAAKADAEARGATHVYSVDAHLYGHELYEPVAKPWSVERVDPLDPWRAPMRRWGVKRAGRELDGRVHDAYPNDTA